MSLCIDLINEPLGLSEETGGLVAVDALSHFVVGLLQFIMAIQFNSRQARDWLAVISERLEGFKGLKGLLDVVKVLLLCKPRPVLCLICYMSYWGIWRPEFLGSWNEHLVLLLFEGLQLLLFEKEICILFALLHQLLLFLIVRWKVAKLLLRESKLFVRTLLQIGQCLRRRRNEV